MEEGLIKELAQISAKRKMLVYAYKKPVFLFDPTDK